MERLKRLFRHEIDADYTACLYAAAFGWLLAFFLWLGGKDGLTFGMVTGIMILSWVAAWLQKLLFLCDETWPRVLQMACWCAIPLVLFSLPPLALGWLSGCAAWVFWGFVLSVFATLILWWVCIQCICADETVEWNSMLTQFKQKEGPFHESGNRLQ